MTSQQSLLGLQMNQPPPQGWSIPTELPSLRGTTRLSLDTECTGKNVFTDKPVGISISYRQENQVIDHYFPFGHSEGNMDFERVQRWAEGELPGKEVVFCHAKFDLHMMRNGLGLDLEKIGVKPSDIQFNEALLDDSRGVKLGLEHLCRKYLGHGKEELDGDKNRMADHPSWVVEGYAKGDSRYTLLIDEKTQPLLAAEGLERVRALEDSIIYAVLEVERNGCRLDVEKLERWRHQVRQEYEALVWDIYKQLGIKVNPNGPEDMLRLFKQLNLEPPPATKNIRAFSVAELEAYKHPIINLVIEARRRSSLLSKFLDKYHEGLDGDILRGQFHQLKSAQEEGEKGEVSRGTVTGRFSASGGGANSGYSFNPQQVIKPKKQKQELGDKYIIRELFVPEPGAKFFSADASQIEYRLAAALSGSKTIIKAYQDDPNMDYHELFLQHIARYKPGWDDRTKTKNFDFGYIYGSSDETTALTIDSTLSEAAELKRICRQVFPEAPVFLKKCSWQAENEGFVQTIFNRRSRFGKGRHENYHAAINRVIQGSAADIFKVTLKAMYDNRHELGISKLRQVVHDELDGDCEPTFECYQRIQNFLNEQRVGLSVPITWNLKLGPNWANCKDIKEMEAGLPL